MLDAFSGDAMPVHLLTREAFETYGRHLAPAGVIAINVANLYLDLRRAIVPLGGELGYSVMAVSSPARPAHLVTEAYWILLGRSRAAVHRPAIEAVGDEPGRDWPRKRPWTDDFASVFPLLILSARPR